MRYNIYYDVLDLLKENAYVKEQEKGLDFLKFTHNQLLQEYLE